MKKSPFELRVDLIPFRVRRQLGIIYWVQSHLQKKKKNPLLNYVLTWSSFGYVGSLISFTEFSHIFKKKKNPLLNYVLTWSPFRYVGNLVSFTEFSHIFKKKSPFELRVDLIPFRVCRQLGIIYWVQSHPQRKKKSPPELLDKKLSWTTWWLDFS